MIPEYTYTLRDGWQTLAAAPHRLSAQEASPGEALEALGYAWIAESAQSDCGVGHFFVWQKIEPDPAWPRYAAYCTQWDDQTVVWLADLPTLWEWIRRYGAIAVVLQRHYLKDDDEEQEEQDRLHPHCPECGETMHRVPLVPLHVVRPAPHEYDA
jgi:hypothetical protein